MPPFVFWPLLEKIGKHSKNCRPPRRRRPPQIESWVQDFLARGLEEDVYFDNNAGKQQSVAKMKARDSENERNSDRERQWDSSINEIRSRKWLVSEARFRHYANKLLFVLFFSHKKASTWSNRLIDMSCKTVTTPWNRTPMHIQPTTLFDHHIDVTSTLRFTAQSQRNSSSKSFRHTPNGTRKS